MKPTLRLTHRHGNGQAILAQALLALRSARVKQSKIDEFIEEATAADYDHLITTCRAWFNVID